MTTPGLRPCRLLIASVLVLAGACDSKGDAPTAKADAKTDAKTVAPPTPKPEVEPPPPLPPQPEPAPEVQPEPEQAPAPTGPVIVDDNLSLGAELVGELHVGMTAAEVEALLGKPETQSPIEEEGATGDFVQSWSYPKKGLDLGMASADARGTDKRLNNITADHTCTMPLPWGLKIGSTRAEVEKVYTTHFDPDFTDPETFVAGSVYGGVFYDFEDGKVRGVFIGAGAE